MLLREDQPFAGQRAKQRLGDVARHPSQALGGVVRRKGLVFVVVVVGQVYLAGSRGRAVAVDLRQHAYLQTPIPGDPVRSRQVGLHRELTRQTVTEAVQKLQQRSVRHHPVDGPNQRSHEQPRHPAVHPVRYPGVERLRELKVEVGIHHRIAQSRQEPAVVIQNVAVVQRDHLALGGCQQVAVRQPAGAPLPVLAGRETLLLQQLEQALDPRAVDPQKRHRPPEVQEEAASPLVLVLAGPAQRDDDVAHVIHLGQLVHDPPHRRTLELGIQRRENQPDGPCLAVPPEFRLQAVDAVGIQPVQGRYATRLVEIGHLPHLRFRQPPSPVPPRSNHAGQAPASPGFAGPLS